MTKYFSDDADVERLALRVIDGSWIVSQPVV
jgi:hypothetical protein